MTTAKRSNQEQAPLCAAFVQAMREAFGADQVTVIYVEENGLVLGAPTVKINQQRPSAAREMQCK